MNLPLPLFSLWNCAMLISTQFICITSQLTQIINCMIGGSCNLVNYKVLPVKNWLAQNYTTSHSLPSPSPLQKLQYFFTLPHQPSWSTMWSVNFLHGSGRLHTKPRKATTWHFLVLWMIRFAWNAKKTTPSSQLCICSSWRCRDEHQDGCCRKKTTLPSFSPSRRSGIYFDRYILSLTFPKCFIATLPIYLTTTEHRVSCH